MKALLVLEDKEKLSLLNKKLTETGYDTICYQWLLKALDNIEEIAPHLIFISAIDYPRHWKTFVQHVRTHFSAEDTAVAGSPHSRYRRRIKSHQAADGTVPLQ